MAKTVETKSGTLLNTKRFPVVITKADGSKFTLESHKQLKGVALEDFQALPAGVEYLY